MHPSRAFCLIPCILHEGIFIFPRIILNTQKISRFLACKPRFNKKIVQKTVWHAPRKGVSRPSDRKNEEDTLLKPQRIHVESSMATDLLQGLR